MDGTSSIASDAAAFLLDGPWLLCSKRMTWFCSFVSQSASSSAHSTCSE